MPISKNGKRYYTEEQYQTARYESSALEYAKAQGYDLVKKGRYYTLREHDSMVFTDQGFWFWNSRNLQGGAIEFITMYEHKDYADAICLLSGEDLITQQSQHQNYAPKPTKPPEEKAQQLPKRAANERNVFAYLTKERKISGTLVQTLIHQGKIYQSEKFGNAVFLLENHKGVTGAYLRDTNTAHSKPFMGVAKGSDRQAGSFFFGGSKEASVACVFEAAIDAMSYATMQMQAGNTDLTARYYVASCGAGTRNILAFLSEHPNIRSVILCQDNDEPGQLQAQELEGRLRAMDYLVSRNLPVHKDFNDDLLASEQSAVEMDALEMDFMENGVT